jgi:hypothetical protein
MTTIVRQEGSDYLVSTKTRSRIQDVKTQEPRS